MPAIELLTEHVEEYALGLSRPRPTLEPAEKGLHSHAQDRSCGADREPVGLHPDRHFELLAR